MLIDIELMARTGGIRVLLHALAEGPLEMAPLLAAAFLHIIDSPRTRAYLRPGTDLEVHSQFRIALTILKRSADRSDWYYRCLW